MEFAKILNQEALELEAAGVDVIQFDEAGLQRLSGRGGDLGHRDAGARPRGQSARPPCTSATEYGIKANIDWKGTLGNEWRQYEKIFPALAGSRIHQVSLECAGSRVPLYVLSMLEGKDVMVGVIDVATDRIETPREVAQTIRDAMKHVAPERIIPCTNCGMVPLSRDVAVGKVEALTKGAAVVRQELGKA